MSKKSDEKKLQQNRDEVRKALEILFASDYFDKKKLYLENFVRGMVFAAGSVFGATILIGTLLWILSLFDTIPLIGPFIDNTRDTIQQGQGTN